MAEWRLRSLSCGMPAATDSDPAMAHKSKMQAKRKTHRKPQEVKVKAYENLIQFILAPPSGLK